MTTLNNYIKVTLDYAPKENGTEFDVWCDKYGFQPLGSGRRAWCGQYQSYFRGALGVACTEAGETFLFEESDLADLTQDRQHIAEVLCDLLEHKKKDLNTGIPYCEGIFEGIMTAQAIIRKTLEGKQE